MVNGLPQFKASKTICIDCMVGTQHRNPIPKKSTWRAFSKLQLIHVDICGPITPISNRKKRYLISFIDDFSRKTWIYFLVEKSEALVIFKQYKSCCRPSILSLDTGIYPSGVTSTHRSHMTPLGPLLGLVGVRASCGFVCGPLSCICGSFRRVTMAIFLVVHITL